MASLKQPQSKAKESLADLAYKLIEEMLITLKLPPHMLVSEEELSRQIGIGRTPVREAVKRLEADGLLTIVPRRGLVVTEIDNEMHLLRLEARRELERLMARRAAVHSTAEEKAKFLELAEAMEAVGRSGDCVTYMRLDKEFNDLTAQAARTPPVAQMMAALHSQTRRFWFNLYRNRRDMPLGWETHAAVMRAIAAGDPEAAADASDRLMDWVEEVARSAIPSKF